MQTLIDKSFQRLLLHPVPELEKYVVFIPQFLKECRERQWPSDWRLHLSFLCWLKNHRDLSEKINEQDCLACLRACAIRWSLMGLEHVCAKGIFLASPFLKNKWVGLMKSEFVEKPSKALLIKSDKKFADHSFAITQDNHLQNLVWQSIF